MRLRSCLLLFGLIAIATSRSTYRRRSRGSAESIKIDGEANSLRAQEHIIEAVEESNDDAAEVTEDDIVATEDLDHRIASLKSEDNDDPEAEHDVDSSESPFEKISSETKTTRSSKKSTLAPKDESAKITKTTIQHFSKLSKKPKTTTEAGPPSPPNFEEETEIEEHDSTKSAATTAKPKQEKNLKLLVSKESDPLSEHKAEDESNEEVDDETETESVESTTIEDITSPVQAETTFFAKLTTKTPKAEKKKKVDEKKNFAASNDATPKTLEKARQEESHEETSKKSDEIASVEEIDASNGLGSDENAKIDEKPTTTRNELSTSIPTLAVFTTLEDETATEGIAEADVELNEDSDVRSFKKIGEKTTAEPTRPVVEVDSAVGSRNISLTYTEPIDEDNGTLSLNNRGEATSSTESDLSNESLNDGSSKSSESKNDAHAAQVDLKPPSTTDPTTTGATKKPKKPTDSLVARKKARKLHKFRSYPRGRVEATTEWSYPTAPGERTAPPGATLSPEASVVHPGEYPQAPKGYQDTPVRQEPEISDELEAVVKKTERHSLFERRPTQKKQRAWHPYQFDCATEVDERGPLCEDWALGGLCQIHKPTMFLFCRKTCLCTGPPENEELRN